MQLSIPHTCAVFGVQPAFKPLVTNYSIMEKGDVAAVNIVAVANDSAAQVKINGMVNIDGCLRWDDDAATWIPNKRVLVHNNVSVRYIYRTCSSINWRETLPRAHILISLINQV